MDDLKIGVALFGSGVLLIGIGFLISSITAFIATRKR
jgi:hypothetical protein